jgi:hypothetical protein
MWHCGDLSYGVGKNKVLKFFEGTERRFEGREGF